MLKGALDGLTKNILLMVGGFLACLSGNFFFGLLIGAGAGVLHCCFGGATAHKGIKEAVKSSLPIAIVVGVIGGVGGMFAEGLHTVGGVLIGIVITLMCGFIGGFIGGSRFYQEQVGDTQPNPTPAQRQEMQDAVENISQELNAPQQPVAPTSAASAVAHLRARRNIVPEDYDEIINTVKDDGTEDPYYSLVKELTGKHVVTKRIIDEAYEKLPSEVKEQYKNDPPLVALTSYAYSKQADTQTDTDSPFHQKVRQLSGMNVVNAHSIDVAYSNIPEEMRKDLPTDQKSALMLFASGKTLSDIKSEAEKEKAEREQEKQCEIELYYNSIPAEQKFWLPEDKAEAVAMHKEKKFLPFMETLHNDYKNIPFAVWKSLVPSNVKEEDINQWMLYHRDELISEFDPLLPPPLCHIPIKVLFEIIPPQERFGRSVQSVVAGAVSSLANVFCDELGEPLRRVPIKTLWLTLDPKDRLHTNAKLKDVKMCVTSLQRKFEFTDHYGSPFLLMLPTYLREYDILELQGMLPDEVAGTNQVSPVYNVLMNIDKINCRVNVDTTTSLTKFTDTIPAKFMRYILEWGTDLDDSSLSDQEFCDKYYASNVSSLLNRELPAPLNEIPLIFFKYLMPVVESLNDPDKTEIAILNDLVEESIVMFAPQFDSVGAQLPYHPICVKGACTAEGNVPWDTAQEVNDDEVWRFWLPPSLRYVDFSDMCEALPAINEATHPENYIITHVTELKRALSLDK